MVGQLPLKPSVIIQEPFPDHRLQQVSPTQCQPSDVQQDFELPAQKFRHTRGKTICSLHSLKPSYNACLPEQNHSKMYSSVYTDIKRMGRDLENKVYFL